MKERRTPEIMEIMQDILTIFQSEVTAAKVAWNGALSAIIRSAEQYHINAEPGRIPLSGYIEKYIEGGLEGNSYAGDGYTDALWLEYICEQTLLDDMEEIIEEEVEYEGFGEHKSKKFYDYVKRYIAEHPLSGYGVEAQVRAYSVVLSEEYMRYAAAQYCLKLWLKKANELGGKDHIEMGNGYTAVPYITMYLEGVTVYMVENMEYRDRETGKQVNDILREQAWGRLDALLGKG